MFNINSFEDLIRLSLRIIARCMLLGGVIVFIISLVWIITNNMTETAISVEKIIGELGYRIVVLGTPCLGLAFVGYGLLSRLVGVRLVLFIIGIFILFYYGWLYASVKRQSIVNF